MKPAILALVTAASLACQSARAEDVPVDRKDLDVLLNLAAEEKCRQLNPPVLTLDAATIIRDKDGRIYVSGQNTVPYKVEMKWCNANIKASGFLVPAYYVVPDPPPSLWSFKVSLAAGVLGREALEGGFSKMWDLGLAMQVVEWKGWHPQVRLGVRSAGLGLGYSLTKNLSVDAGYALTWTMHHNPYLGVSLALW